MIHKAFRKKAVNSKFQTESGVLAEGGCVWQEERDLSSDHRNHDQSNTNVTHFKSKTSNTDLSVKVTQM